MKADQLARAIAICAQAGRPTMTRSSPGIGKSSLHRQISRALGLKMLDRRLAQEDAVDSKGMPAVVKGRTVWAQPSWFPQEPNTYAIFFDEFPQANTLTMNAYSELILDGTMGGQDNYKLPAGTPLFLAGNLDTDRAGTNRMPTHLNNRLVHFTMDFDLDGYIQHHMDPDAIPSLNIPKIEKTSQMHETVMAFARFRPNIIAPAFDAATATGAYPTPRSWSFVSDLLPYLLVNDDLTFSVVSGCVGEGPAIEFTSFLKLITKMPDPDLIFKQPEAAPIPLNEPGIMYALMVALSARVTPKTADALFTYLNRPTMPQDFSVICVKDAVKRNTAILTCKQGMAWTVKNSKYLI